MANNSVDGGELNAVANENDTAISTDHSEYSYMDGGKQKKMERKIKNREGMVKNQRKVENHERKIARNKPI